MPFIWIMAPVYLVFACVAHLLFGAYLTEFSTVGAAAQSLFNMLLGQTDWTNLRGPAALYGAGAPQLPNVPRLPVLQSCLPPTTDRSTVWPGPSWLGTDLTHAPPCRVR